MTGLEKAASQGAMSFLSKILPQSLTDIGGIFGDNMKLIRWKNQIKILEKAQQLLKEKNISEKKVSLKAIVPLLEYSSLEEEKTLQEMWANLLANTVSINQQFENIVLVKILSELTTIDVKIISFVYSKKEISNILLEAKVTSKMLYRLHKGNERDISIDNLLRLRLIVVATEHYDLGTQKYYALSDIGFFFMKKCTTVE